MIIFQFNCSARSNLKKKSKKQERQNIINNWMGRRTGIKSINNNDHTCPHPPLTLHLPILNDQSPSTRRVLFNPVHMHMLPTGYTHVLGLWGGGCCVFKVYASLLHLPRCQQCQALCGRCWRLRFNGKQWAATLHGGQLFPTRSMREWVSLSLSLSVSVSVCVASGLQLLLLVLFLLLLPLCIWISYAFCTFFVFSSFSILTAAVAATPSVMALVMCSFLCLCHTIKNSSL